METIMVNIQRCGRNYGAAVDDDRVQGSVVATAKTYEALQGKVRDALRFHVEGMLADGDPMPEWLARGDYQIEWRPKPKKRVSKTWRAAEKNQGSFIIIDPKFLL